jgi:arylsulfate sulfotransferase
LQAQGDFSLNAGQHSVTYLPSSDTAPTGRYQVLLYDNNFGAAESYPKFDWGQLGAAVVTDYNKGTHSFGRIFTVDEAARTYELEDQIAVPFSGYVSSAQRVGDSNSMLVASGQAKTFTEYDRYGRPITSYEMEAEKYIYRVCKYEL